MKKIIKRKVYDTSKAIPIGTYKSDLPEDDELWLMEKLYTKKSTGEFFFNGVGGQKTVYWLGSNPTHATSKIIPCSREDAMAWVAKHLKPEVYDRLFTVERIKYDEAERKTRISFAMRPSVYKAAKQLARENEMSVSGMIEEMIKEKYGFDNIEAGENNG